LSLACVALASCAEGSTEEQRDDQGSGGGLIGAGGSTSTGGSSIKSDATLTEAGPFAALPPPWLYYADGSTFAYKDKSLGADVKDKFGGAADPANKPELIYPLDKSLHPNNVLLITFQWKQGSAANTVFKIEGTAGSAKFDFYVPCTDAAGQCKYNMPYSEWLDIAARQQATFIVYGTDGAGGAVAASAPITLDFSPEPVMGGLYYWASSIGTIKRATFGASQAVDYISPGDANLGLGDTPCVACHSVSRDGKKIAFSVTSSPDSKGSDAPWGVFVLPTSDLTKPLVSPPMNTGVVMGSFGSNVALNADGSLMAVNGSDKTASPQNPLYLDVRLTNDWRDRSYTAQMGSDVFKPFEIGLLPEWSPDGNTLAVTLASSNGWTGARCFWDHCTCNGTIGLMAWDGVSLNQAVVLVKNAPGHQKDAHFYPTWSPDGKWIAFVSQVGQFDVGDAGSAGNNWGLQSSYDAKNGVLRMVPSDINNAPYTCPGPKCVELYNATQYTWDDALALNGKGSTLPKFAPFAQGDGESLMFITYTSRMDYGFTTGDIRQLWMSAIDVSKITPAADGGSPADPSHVPFWVPYQATDKNVEPYWTKILSCTKDPKGGCQGCVGGETCVTDQFNNCHCEISLK
jgi:hypothetical protein